MATLVGNAPGYCSTYQDTYRISKEHCPSLPPIKYNQPPAFQLKDATHQLAPRFFPLIPSGPHRVLEKGRALGPGIGTAVNTARYLDKKPIIKTPPPRDVVNSPPPLLKRRRSAKGARHVSPQLSSPSPELTEQTLVNVSRIPSQILDALCNHVTWTSTTRMATEEAILPINKVSPETTTFEENADMVKYRPAKYESNASDWQKVALMWDRAQIRSRTNPRDSPNYRSDPGGTRKEHMLTRRGSEERLPLENEITWLIRNGKLSSSYERPCPRYAGFRPRSPVNTPREKIVPRRLMETEMQASYRPKPISEVRIQPFEHKGPLSRTVTLTYPYNPFNKVVEKVL